MKYEDNETLVRVGPGTSMGEVMRRYWIPAALSRELPAPDCAPIRVKLLGEKLVAFRDTSGRVGLLDEFCPHRRASLFLGRNEEGGLRCIYHGWKFDFGGNCLDMLSEPLERAYKNNVKVKSYPIAEIGGIIWAYLGPSDKKPSLPLFEWTQQPETHRFVQKVWEECNWLQAMEGGIDWRHAPILHRAINPDTKELGGYRGIRTNERQRGYVPLDVEGTDYGAMMASFVKLGGGNVWAQVEHHVMPFHTFFAAEIYDVRAEGQDVEIKPLINGHIFVPMDDENTMTYNWHARYAGAPLSSADIAEYEERKGRGPGELTADFRKMRNKNNDWLIDRRTQRTETYTGIVGNNTQDHAAQESMGPIVDRTQEHLGTSDRMIIFVRQQLLDAAKIVREGGEPPGVQATYYNVRAADRIISTDDAKRWRETLRRFFNPAPKAELEQV
jgi:phthalate 4,5-dioxygenase